MSRLVRELRRTKIAVSDYTRIERTSGLVQRVKVRPKTGLAAIGRLLLEREPSHRYEVRFPLLCDLALEHWFGRPWQS